MKFTLIPSIDLRAGKVVRLRQGDFASETVYGDDPVGQARAFIAAGARWLHVVDLDGARKGRPVQLSLAREIVLAGGNRAHCELAGGLRSRRDITAALATGAGRIVLGTAALGDTSLVAELVAERGADRVAVALDVRGGSAVGEGWRLDAPSVRVETVLERLSQVGVRTFEVTAIERDGLLGGPDLALLARLVRVGAGEVIASAGITSIHDLLAVRDIGCVGAIVGRALYEGRVDLAAGIAAVRSDPLTGDDAATGR